MESALTDIKIETVDVSNELYKIILIAKYEGKTFRQAIHISIHKNGSEACRSLALNCLDFFGIYT